VSPTQDRAPAFPFYPKDWLSDPKVRALTDAQRGRYMDLLASMWEHGDDGCQMPLSTARKLAGENAIRSLTTGPCPILDLFEGHRDGVQYVFSNRLFQEAQKCRSRRAAAQAAARARWGQQ